MKNLSIISKFLIILAVFGLFSLGSAFYATGQMRGIAVRFGQLINGPEAAAQAILQANRYVQALRADLELLQLATSMAQSHAAVASANADRAAFDKLFAKSAAAAPDEAVNIHALAARADGLMDNSCAASIQMGLAATAKADVAAAQAVYMQDCAPGFPPLVADLTAERQILQDHITKSTLSISQDTKTTILLTYAMILLGILAVMGTGYLAIRAWIVLPLGTIHNVMTRLAGGDHSAEVGGQDRRDEVGAMARAVQVFKEAAVEKLRLEDEARKLTARTEAERVQIEAERAETVRQQQSVVNSVAVGLEELSNGDLMFRLNTPFPAEYEKLRGDFNIAMEKLLGTMCAISGNTQGVRAGAGEITQASDDLARRTEQQAASLEETAAALDEITATVRATAKGAAEARDVVAGAKEDAERSGDVVRETVTAMSGIEESSKQIGNIIGVIDEIAFQTNLLALNAGVEAARAGDAGRGFAVVATEVRALAQRSADAAKEIKSLISTSGKQVDTGVKLVGETGKALGRIVEQVNRLNTLVTGIAGSAQEQATGLAEVNSAVNQMDQVTQQNAAMVEQATAASHSLSGEAEALARLVAQFQIGAAAAPPRAAQRPASRPAATPVKTAVSTRPAKASVPALAGDAGSGDWDEF